MRLAKQVGLTFLISLYFTGLLPLLSNADSYVSVASYILLVVKIVIFDLFFLAFCVLLRFPLLSVAIAGLAERRRA